MTLIQQPCVEVTSRDGSVLVLPFDNHRERGQFVEALLAGGSASHVRYFFRPAPAALPE
jgi:hypothetical protein